MTRTEALRMVQEQARTQAWSGVDMIRVLVEYGRAVAELASGVPPETVTARWNDDFYLPDPAGAPGHSRAVFWGEEPWK